MSSLGSSSKSEVSARVLSLIASGALPQSVAERVAKLSAPQTLASCGQDKTVRLWDICTGECKKTLFGHTDAVTCIAPYRGNTFFTGSNDGTVREWDGSTGKCIHVFEGHTHYVRSLCVLAERDVPVVASGSRDKTIIVWRISSGTGPSKVEAVLEGGGLFGVSALATAEHDTMLISGDEDGHIRLWDTRTWEEIPTSILGHNAAIESIKVLERGQETLLITCGGDGDNSAKVWDLHSGKCIHTFKGHCSGVWNADFVCVGKRCGSGMKAEAQLLTVSDGEALVRPIGGKGGEEVSLFKSMSPYWISAGQINAVAFAQCCDPDVAAAWGKAGDREKVGTPNRVKNVERKENENEKDKKKSKHSDSRDDMCPLAVAQGKNIYMWSFPQMEKSIGLVGHTGTVYDLCFLPL